MAEIKIITNFVIITNNDCMENGNRYSIERLTTLLQEKGIRPSAQRIAVLSAVANSSKHPSAGCSRYDMALQAPHSHFICRRCSRIFDMPMPDGMSEVIAPQFDIDAVEVTLRGLCPECKKIIN